MMILILGGSGSGKSAYAEDYLLRTAGDKKKYYIATMQIWDEEMQAKVDRHHRLRQGKGFTTIEQPTELEQAASQMEPEAAVLLECMSNLAANEMFSREQPVDRETVIAKILQGIEVLRKQADPLVIVTNNVFEDGIAYDSATIEYIEALGRVNERLAGGDPAADQGVPDQHRKETGMRIIKSFFIAFSMYSKIPMPQFEWKDEDMRYALCFFPWVGAVIGVLWYLWKWICARFGVGTLCYTVVGTAIPILITGGFHVDGFLDTCDALHSYQPRERKLEILKDSHIGAFAVIMLTLYGLIFLGGFSEITECRTLVVVGAGSFLSRVLSGVAVVSFPSAKQEGTLYLFADKAHKRVVKTALYAQGILCIGFMMWTSFVTGGIAVAAALLTFAYYYYRSKKEFGGITGDTAGYFVTFCEGCVVVAAAIAEHMMLTV